MTNKFIRVLALIFCIVSTITAQTLTLNPLSKLGIGEIIPQTNIRQNSMGNTSIGDYYSFNINKNNPASLAALLNNRALFDLGFFAKVSYFFQDTITQISTVGNLSQITGGFRINKWWVLAFGMSPYSAKGYTIIKKDTLLADNQYIQPYLVDYSGKGNINQIFLSNSITFFKRFSIGATINYNFGYFSNNISIVLDDSTSQSITEIEKRDSYNKLTYNFGLLFNDTIKKHSKPFIRYSIGAIFNNKSDFIAQKTRLIQRSTSAYQNTFQDILVIDTLGQKSFSLPKTLGLGFSITYRNSLTFNFDYINQYWQGLTLLDDNNFVNASFQSFGIEYCPNMYSSNYFKTISYRIGFFNYNDYRIYNGYQLNTKALTFGLTLPFKSINFNLGFQLGKTSNLHNGLKENFAQINISLTLIDLWFIKRYYN